MKEHLDLNRFISLLRVDLTNLYRTMIVASGAIAGVMIVLIVLFRVENSDGLYVALLIGMLFVWGPIASSRSLREMHDKTRNEAYLILPASALEKMLVRLLLVTVVFAVYAVVFVTVLSWLTTALQTLLNGNFGSPFSPAPFLDPAFIGYYLVNQSVFFLGGAWFRKQHFMKTILTVTLFWIGLACFTAFVFRVFFPDLTIVGGIDPDAWFRYYQDTIFGVFHVIGFAYFAVLPVLCWFIAWLRIKETQVSYGV